MGSLLHIRDYQGSVCYCRSGVFYISLRALCHDIHCSSSFSTTIVNTDSLLIIIVARFSQSFVPVELFSIKDADFFDLSHTKLTDNVEFVIDNK